MKLFGILMSAFVIVALLLVSFASPSADASATPMDSATAKASCCSAVGTADCCAPGAECCVVGAECCEEQAACCIVGEACCEADATHAISVGESAVRGLASAKTASSCCDGSCGGGPCFCSTGDCCDDGCFCCETGDCSCAACGCECCAL